MKCNYCKGNHVMKGDTISEYGVQIKNAYITSCSVAHQRVFLSEISNDINKYISGGNNP